MRLLPKEDGIRPVINLSRRRLAKGMARTKALSPSINTVLAPVGQMLRLERELHPERLGSAIFSVGDIYTRIKAFKACVLASSSASTSLPPFYFAKGPDIFTRKRFLRGQLHSTAGSMPRLKRVDYDECIPRILMLHGDIRHAYCVVCRSIVVLEPESFQGSRPPSCRSCASRQRRAAAIGVLRPRIRLYDQDDGAIDDEAIQLVVADDSRAPLDALLVVGTALRIPGAARLVDKLLASVRLFADGGVTAWVNPLVQPPTSLASRFDLKVSVEADALVDMVEPIS
ncbi:hypothetical protein NPX13_g8685 [Xylaria arbuscula]|uniref:Telomerase reverse transcriptase n=1 Tax=Xylaria arbuscula TaxID=114810 RepID=A0A9W8TJL0_9PEZI|nr:hypothetical protein NPX13_g8685 [Xylaria arbuscula]